VGFSVSGILYCRLVGASLSTGYSFNVAPELEEEKVALFKETVVVFDFEWLVFGENILDLGVAAV